MESRDSGGRGIKITSLLTIFFILINVNTPSFSQSATARIHNSHPLGNKLYRKPAPSIVEPKTNSGKLLKRMKPGTSTFNLLKAKYAEVEIAINEKFNKEKILDLQRAPGSNLYLLDNPRRIRLQLPAEQVKALIDSGAEVTVLRKFILYENLKNANLPAGSDTEVHIYGESSQNVYMKSDYYWWGSGIKISGAPSGAEVTSIDVHCKIEPSWISIVSAELCNEDDSIFYRLIEGEYGGYGTITKTKKGITRFNGEPVNQMWWLYGHEDYGDETGYIDYWWIKIYYQDDEPLPQLPDEYYIQADPYFENTVDIFYFFQANPGTVSFSLSDECGSLDPTSDNPVSYSGGWLVSTTYTPCEDECSSVEITANPIDGTNQTATVYLDDRLHTFCCETTWLGVLTPDSAYVTVNVIPPEAGTVEPTSGWSQYNSSSGYYEFWSDYAPTFCYSDRARVKFTIDNSTYEDSVLIFSFEQEPVIVPSSSWQTVTDSFCTEGLFLNNYQVYKMYLYSAYDYDFSLREDDDVGAWCDGGDGDLEMLDSSCTDLWDIFGEYNASTLGTDYQGWSPPSDGYYYLIVSDFFGYQISYSLAYKQSIHIEPINVNMTLNNNWMYQNLPVRTNSQLQADAIIANDPLSNSSYSYTWEFITPNDVTLEPVIIGPNDTNNLTFASRCCNEVGGLSDLGEPFKVKVTITGNDFGNTGTAEQEFGVALLGDVNNDSLVNVADRGIINTYWRTGISGSFDINDCDINCDGVVNVADRGISNLIWRGMLGDNNVTNPCPFH